MLADKKRPARSGFAGGAGLIFNKNLSRWKELVLPHQVGESLAVVDQPSFIVASDAGEVANRPLGIESAVRLEVDGRLTPRSVLHGEVGGPCRRYGGDIRV